MPRVTATEPFPFLSRRDFLARSAAASSVIAIPPPACAQWAGAAVDVTSFGARGDGMTDDTSAFEAALASGSVVSVPAGTFVLGQIRILSGKTLVTQGRATVLRQKPRLPSGTPIIKVVGSNVVIGSLRAIGNIATDQGEWMHAIDIHASPATGNLSNISIGDIFGENIRGDVLAIYSSDGRTVSQVRVGRLVGSNIYRNVASVCTGRAVEIAAVHGTAVGYMVLDAEPDGTCAPVIGLRVGYVKGRFAAVVGTDSERYCEAVHIDVLDLDTSNTTGSSPAFPPGERLIDGLQVRNSRSLTIGHYRAMGFHGQAIRQLYERGDVSHQSIIVGRAVLSECCRTESTYLSYIQGAPRTTFLQIAELNVKIDRPGVAAVKSCYGARIGTVSASLGPDAHLVNDIEGGFVGPVNVRGSGTLIVNGRGTVIRGGVGSGTYIAAYSRGLRFENVRLTGGFSGPQNGHVFENSTVNGHAVP